MAETKYESKIVSCASSTEAAFRVCSNLQNLERAKDFIPQDKIQELEFAEDLVRFKVDGLGQKIGVRIIAKEENDYVKYGIENAPVDGNFWIQFKSAGEHETRIKLTIKVDLPMMFKMLIGNKLQTAIDQVADMLATFPFEKMDAQ